jgi:hypothetical protein
LPNLQWYFDSSADISFRLKVPCHCKKIEFRKKLTNYSRELTAKELYLTAENAYELVKKPPFDENNELVLAVRLY